MLMMLMLLLLLIRRRQRCQRGEMDGWMVKQEEAEQYIASDTQASTPKMTFLNLYQISVLFFEKP